MVALQELAGLPSNRRKIMLARKRSRTDFDPTLDRPMILFQNIIKVLHQSMPADSSPTRSRVAPLGICSSIYAHR
jgi:hypothetical protein